MADRVLVLSGLDPCGGAGIAADIETLNQFAVTALPIVTTLTAQNTRSVQATQAIDAQFIAKQIRHLQVDIDFSVVKIGLLSSGAQIKTFANLLKDKIIVLDPIIRASSNSDKGDFLNSELLLILKRELLPITTIITPNLAELQALSGEKNEHLALTSLPCEWVLLTTTDSSDKKIQHRLYRYSQLVQRFNYQKLAGNYHGSGCTLSSAISALLALGVDMQSTCKRALDYTYQTLLNAKEIGKMQLHPSREKPL